MPALIVPGAPGWPGGVAPGAGRVAEAGDAVAFQSDHAEARCVRQLAQQHPAGDAGVVRGGGREQVGQVAVEQGVAVAEQEAVVQVVAGVEHGAAGAGAERFLRDRDAGFSGKAGLDRRRGGGDLVGQVAGEQQEVGDAEAHEFAQQPGEEGAVTAGQQRLRRGGGEAAQAGAEAANQHGTLADCR